MTGQYRSLIFLGFVMCLSLIAGCAIYVFIILRGGDFGWDEAAHALRGLTIAYDIGLAWILVRHIPANILASTSFLARRFFISCYRTQCCVGAIC
jgi:hypothetical protein